MRIVEKIHSLKFKLLILDSKLLKAKAYKKIGLSMANRPKIDIFSIYFLYLTYKIHLLAV